MQDVEIRFTAGPQRDQRFEAEVGRLVIGRMPGEGGLELLAADTSVSRLHAELVEKGGGIELRNLSDNGTVVNDKLVMDACDVRPGATIRIGSQHVLSVTWRAPHLDKPAEGKGAKSRKGSAPAKKGPLSSPLIRGVIGVYLLGIVGVAGWLALDDAAPIIDDWPALIAQYEARADSGEESRETMLARAEVLVRELRARRSQGDLRDVERICREIMSLDRNVTSPLYQYGIRCLANR